VYRQLHYIQNKNLGYSKDQILLVRDANILGNHAQTFKDAVLKLPGVQSATMTSYLPVPSSRSSNAIFPEGQTTEKTTPVQTWRVDSDYFKTLKMNMVQGRGFAPELSSDSMAVVVNESAVALFGWENPIGKTISTFTDMNANTKAIFHVIGVVENFHFQSLRNQIEPMTLFLAQSRGYVAIRIQTDQISSLIAELKQLWEKFAPNQPFTTQFMDDRFDSVYRVEQRIGRLFTIASSMAIIIGCLGLLGLAAFTAEQKTKEIGVRKVLGASMGSVVFLMSKTFTKWVLAANAIAWPLAYFLMHRWLEGFAYRVELSISVFLLAGSLTLLIALFTVSFQAFKAALTNPAKSLKCE
jgi:putative ABC transport system permease protein